MVQIGTYEFLEYEGDNELKKSLLMKGGIPCLMSMQDKLVNFSELLVNWGEDSNKDSLRINGPSTRDMELNFTSLSFFDEQSMLIGILFETFLSKI